MPNSHRFVIINGDDFSFSRGVNQAIIQAHERRTRSRSASLKEKSTRNGQLSVVRVSGIFTFSNIVMFIFTHLLIFTSHLHRPILAMRNIVRG